ncbi:histidine kinase [Blastococcus sp. BMG 814]|uniref:histidine kinase n=1 Tax=Blastococcus carthaginiensis TaxID=3050034 RepID=A0ABT9ICG0_9ACTN|nr:histidine kinase [Blastococcus carthaginiensis]MDP5183261.1 histidine kinase [Blastococcus carthaginiensis]
MPRLSPPSLRDLALPLGLGALATVEALSVRPEGMGPAIAVAWGASLGLIFRRRWTLVVGTLAGAVLLLPYVGPELSDLTSPALIVWLAGFSLGRHLPDLRGLPVMVLFLVAVFGPPAVDAGELPGIDDLLWVGTLLLSPYAVGVAVRSFDDRHDRLTERAEQLVAAQEDVRQQAVAAERARIARELHDVLAHSVSAMVVQASAAEDLVRTDPDRAAQVLREVSSVGRNALAETGRLLHLIRDSDDELGLAPGAGLARLPELVDGFRRSGLQVDLAPHIPLGLPPGLDLSAYRIVQEALTNALRHGADGTVQVRVADGPAALDICVENPTGPGGTAGSGLGLVGVTERVAVFGGQLEHGPTGDGRYLLHATLPLPEARR